MTPVAEVASCSVWNQMWEEVLTLIHHSQLVCGLWSSTRKNQDSDFLDETQIDRDRRLKQHRNKGETSREA